MRNPWNPWVEDAVLPMAAATHTHGIPTLALTNLSGTTASASNGLTLSLSAAPPGAGGGIAAAAGTQTATSGTVVFANSNGLTFGMSGSSQITGSHNGLTTARASNDAVGLNTAATQVTWTVNSQGISLNAGAYLTTAAQSGHTHGNPTLALTNLAGTTASASNGFTLSLSHNISTAAQSNHTHGNPTLALTNLTGTTASASNGLTISLSAAAPGAGGGFAAQGSGTYTQNTGTIQFANSNGITFGLSTNQMTASHNGLTTAAQSDHSHGNPTLALTNLTGTTASASNGLTLSLSAAAPGGGAAWSQYGGVMMPAGPPMVNITNLTATAMTNRILFFPFHVFGNLTCQELMWYMSRATSGSNLFTVSQAFYTFVNSSQISLLASTSFQFSATNTASVSGIRIFELTPAQTTLSPGQYVLAMHFSGAATASINYSLMGSSTLNWAPAGVIHPGADQNTVSGNATSHQLINFWGRYTAATAALPNSIGLNQVSGIGTFALPVMFWFGTHN
jgi:hypothetical protein